ncbi:site-specific DNA-methyltransferase [Campylobacter coli]|nr:site-specific DNA-methyltransferase [Campylobacter coli]
MYFFLFIIGVIGFYYVNDKRVNDVYFFCNNTFNFNFNTMWFACHPTQKPLKLIECLISISNLKENAVILDPFGGGGTTVLASNNLKYDCITIEKEFEYCNLINNRLLTN